MRRCQQHKAPQYLIVLRQPRTSPADSDYALPVVTNFLCRVTNSAHLVVGPSLSLDQRLGIRCRLTSVTRRVVFAPVTRCVQVSWLQQSTFRCVRLSTFRTHQYWCVQRIRGFYDDALYKSTLSSIYLSNCDKKQRIGLEQTLRTEHLYDMCSSHRSGFIIAGDLVCFPFVRLGVYVGSRHPPG